MKTVRTRPTVKREFDNIDLIHRPLQVFLLTQAVRQLGVMIGAARMPVL
jgi:hypothetical protein